MHPYSIEIARRNRENPNTQSEQDNITEDEEEQEE